MSSLSLSQMQTRGSGLGELGAESEGPTVPPGQSEPAHSPIISFNSLSHPFRWARLKK